MVVRKVFFVGVLLGCFFFPFSEICVLPVGIFNRALKIGVIFWVFFLKDIWKLFFFILFFFPSIVFMCKFGCFILVVFSSFAEIGVFCTVFYW